jgi:benzoyl-CoA reductase/2-hydroxyglutaryl-CoA dehydratase subunit BcrC/BadD/HgdB
VLPPLDEDGADPIDTIGRAYFFRPSCARMMGNFPQRWDALRSDLRRARAEGIIFERLLFCDSWGAEQYNLNKRCREQGIPLLSLNREYGIVPTGQLRTRVQAFVERIEIASHQEADG